MKVEIRHKKVSDRDTIFSLNKEAFGQMNEANLVDALRKSSAFIPELSLVGWVGDQGVGHIFFTNLIIQSPSGETFRSLALAPMAVAKAYQNRGVGSRLVQSGLDRVKALGFASVTVLGHPKYYLRFGFVPASRWGIKAPFDVSDDAFMAKELEADALAGVLGVVEYPK